MGRKCGNGIDIILKNCWLLATFVCCWVWKLPKFVFTPSFIFTNPIGIPSKNWCDEKKSLERRMRIFSSQFSKKTLHKFGWENTCSFLLPLSLFLLSKILTFATQNFSIEFIYLCALWGNGVWCLGLFLRETHPLLVQDCCVNGRTVWKKWGRKNVSRWGRYSLSMFL